MILNVPFEKKYVLEVDTKTMTGILLSIIQLMIWLISKKDIKSQRYNRFMLHKTYQHKLHNSTKSWWEEHFKISSRSQLC